MKKQFYYLLGAFILSVVIFSLLLSNVGGKITKEIDDIESHISNHVVVEGDTLFITDFSLFENTYTVQDKDGDTRKLNYKIIEKAEVVNK